MDTDTAVNKSLHQLSLLQSQTATASHDAQQRRNKKKKPPNYYQSAEYAAVIKLNGETSAHNSHTESNDVTNQSSIVESTNCDQQNDKETIKRVDNMSIITGFCLFLLFSE